MVRTSSNPFAVFCFCVGVLLCGASPAETWSDVSGKFTIEAEYVGVQDSSVVLRKADGKNVTVPIGRLSPESRDLAKRLYARQQAQPQAAAPPRSVAGASAIAPDADGEMLQLSASPSAEPLNFVPPTPAPVPAMLTFPEEASLQETVDFVRTQLLAGHPEVIWEAVPLELRHVIDNPAFRDLMRPQLEAQREISNAMNEVLLKLTEVLVNKKEFVKQTPLLTQQAPPAVIALVDQAYDPAVGILYESAMFTAALDKMYIAGTADADRSTGSLVGEHGPRIGSHLRTLIQMAPPGLMQQYTAVDVEQSSDDAGTLSIVDAKGERQSMDVVRYRGRWVPKDLADRLNKLHDGSDGDLAAALIADFQANNPAAAVDPQTAQSTAESIRMLGSTALDPLLAASTQQEFDQAFMQTMMSVAMMGRAMSPQ